LKYYVSLTERPEQEPIVVDLVELPNGSIAASIGERAVTIDTSAAGPCLSVRVDGVVVDLAFDGNDLHPVARGPSRARTTGRVESERARSAHPARERAAATEPTVVRSPMPGRVVRVLVARGASVQERQGLIVLEAMKMENEVRAPAAGTVADVHVAAGEAVEANAKLVTLA
jgi:glutaconyl-CoA/methylmalonyl-CoA decarboxylase subunit gamma